MKGMGIGIIVGVFIVLGYLYFTSNRISYVLYRGSDVNENSAVYIASFDAKESEKYNRENCEIARDLFQAQPFVRVKYWCNQVSSNF